MSSYRKLTALGFALVAITLMFMLFASQPEPSPYSGASYYSIFEGLEGEEEEEDGLVVKTEEEDKKKAELVVDSVEKTDGVDGFAVGNSFVKAVGMDGFSFNSIGGNLLANTADGFTSGNSSVKNSGITGFFDNSVSGNSSAMQEGFEPIMVISKTLSPGSLRDSEIIDKFSKITVNGIEGKDGCISSGLTNSGGSICLTPELVQLLKTRGGNATGGDSHVGQPRSS